MARAPGRPSGSGLRPQGAVQSAWHPARFTRSNGVPDRNMPSRPEGKTLAIITLPFCFFLVHLETQESIPAAKQAVDSRYGATQHSRSRQVDFFGACPPSPNLWIAAAPQSTGAPPFIAARAVACSMGRNMTRVEGTDIDCVASSSDPSSGTVEEVVMRRTRSPNGRPPISRGVTRRSRQPRCRGDDIAHELEVAVRHPHAASCGPCGEANRAIRMGHACPGGPVRARTPA